jgi:hypothetical protein
LKTTVSIPEKVLNMLQRYIAETPGANLRDQSSVVILALVEYLNSRMEERHRINPAEILDDKACRKFNVIEIKQ